MARPRRSILESVKDVAPLQDVPAPATEEAPPGPQTPAPAARITPTRAARKPAQTPAETPTAPPVSDAPDGRPAPAGVRVPSSTAAAERVGLYLHPDDFRDLGMARLDDKVDQNARIRAMIALWRDNPRYRAAVDKLARTSPRGPGPR